MKALFKESSTFTKIEFWVITTIFAFAMFFFIVDAFQSDEPPFKHIPLKYRFDEAGVPFHFREHYFIPVLINYVTAFISILCLNFVFIPRLIKRKALLQNILFLIAIIALSGIVFGFTTRALHAFEYAGNARQAAVDQQMFEEGFLDAFTIIVVLAIYTAIKYAGMYFLSISEKIEEKYPFIRKEAIVATAIWLAGILFLRFSRADREILIGWTIVIPTAITLYLFSFHRLIPRSLAHNKYPFFSYVIKCAGLLFATFIALYILSMFMTSNDDAGAGYSAFNSFFQLFVTVPITWFVYKRLLKGNEEINVLQKELKRSSANLHFLRSQINPHFLFNAMNTLYGTAIQEGAERTSEGIEKLSDMMRFMLQENVQEKISLAREIDYLNNYISLQKLRTDPNPNIRINTDIQEQVNGVQIAPMLLIPFVENAFKHGISFREPTEIKVILEVNDKTVYFDVYNTRHQKLANDPEKDKSGIGLNNVKQRLQLLYKGKHELLIRETAKDFFVHLTIHLS